MVAGSKLVLFPFFPLFIVMVDWNIDFNTSASVTILIGRANLKLSIYPHNTVASCSWPAWIAKFSVALNDDKVRPGVISVKWS